MEHYILCASIVMCIALHFARQAAMSAGIPTSLLTCDLTRELGYFTHSICLQFLCLQDQISQVCITSLCGPWAKVAYLHFIYSLRALHVYECNQLYQIYFSDKLNQVFNSSISSASYFSIDLLRFSFSIPLQLYTC